MTGETFFFEPGPQSVSWNLHTTPGRLIIIVVNSSSSSSMTLTACLALTLPPVRYHDCPQFPLKKLMLGKEMPFLFGRLSVHIAHTYAELHTHSGPHLHPRTHRGSHMPQPDRHTCVLTYGTACVHAHVHVMCVCVGYLHICTHVRTGPTLLDIHFRVGKGV